MLFAQAPSAMKVLLPCRWPTDWLLKKKANVALVPLLLAKTVRAKGAVRRRDLIASSNEPEDATETASVWDTAGVASAVYVHVALAKGEFDGEYTLQVRPGR